MAFVFLKNKKQKQQQQIKTLLGHFDWFTQNQLHFREEIKFQWVTYGNMYCLLKSFPIYKLNILPIFVSVK